ncbi:HAD family hydrolase [Paenibacillus humicola]|uniref:HAD family hydrolase n=1 Tax=Paenibacillus humicola TaxID=3110540 RepID=UPI00237C505E|nr:HAD family hydrolase [Paenibacillus humicola]
MNITGIQSRIEAVFFDLDDTLYDQLDSFRGAVEDTLPADLWAGLEMDELFRRVRYYGDRLLDRYAAGKLTFKELRVQRMILAFADLGIALDERQAETLQTRYRNGQQRIKLSPGAGELIAALQRGGLDVGILTNGPVDHQMNKIRSLGLDAVIQPGRLFISDALGIAKPDPRVFLQVSEITGHAPERCLYVGDAWVNDVTGPLEAGWHSIWLNKRGDAPSSGHRPDRIVGALEDIA